MNFRSIISERERNLPGTMIGRLLRMAEESRSVISLGPGEPDFCAPMYVIDAMKRAVSTCETHYSPTSGRKELKEAIVRKLKRENKIDASPENVIVTNGSTEAIMLSLMCLVDPGEEVLVPDPGFLGYIPTIELLNGFAVSVPLRQSENFQMTGDAIRAQIVNPKKLRAIIINTPGNPTGTVLKKRALEEIADVAIEYNVPILSDEAYERFVYGSAKHVSIASLNGMEDYVVTFQSFSKTFAMPGFRIGYAVGPKPLIEAMSKLHIYTTLCAPTPSQMAATVALNDTKNAKKSVGAMVMEYARRRRLILKRLREIKGFRVDNPEGAFYLFPSFQFKKRMTSAELVEWMIRNARVSAVPGSEFGRYGEGYVRFSYATAYDLIEKAMDRLESAAKKM
ncbi:MAG: aminotransferase class I/II-fold pyridoxal phosphate-dependent enzyme [Candidatus Aenigmatarchaeota archaeon]|nr:MAG: aminotransferase class I/II-fold pyridoxal phosphate-dependent enzyme [Candidatus Aenigmarchaeota archaeon]